MLYQDATEFENTDIGEIVTLADGRPAKIVSASAARVVEQVRVRGEVVSTIIHAACDLCLVSKIGRCHRTACRAELRLDGREVALVALTPAELRKWKQGAITCN
jgi:hypothetical protein